MIPKNLFKAGYVSKAHGLKGEITVNLEKVDLPDTVEEAFLEFNGKITGYMVEHFSARPDKAFIKLRGVNSLDEARNLRGHLLFLRIPVRTRKSKDSFYNEEIEGFQVDDIQSGIIGQVIRITSMAGNRYLEVSHEGRQLLIPENGPFIQKIDRRKKLILVDLPDGFTDI